LTAVIAVLSLTILIPLYFTIITALKTPADAGTFGLPGTWEWHNFADAWNKVNYPKAALNSALITVAAVVLTLLTNTFVAYAVARNMDKRFFRFMYYFFIAAMFVPFPVIMLPIAKQFGSWHLDNQIGLVLLYMVLGLGTNLFIATGFHPFDSCLFGRSGENRWCWDLAHLLEDYLPADGTYQRYYRNSDSTVGLERLPVAIDYFD
jgi:raffinose/stachyose/melibiose transport system permease protein